MNLILIIIIILILIYISCYFIFPPSTQILQTTVNDFTFPILYTRQPIVIDDYIQEKEDLIYSWFNYNFIKKLDTNDNDEPEWKHNNYKYLFMNANADTEVIIYKASISSKIPDENDRIIAIKLKKDQSLIIPYKWKYFINKNEDVSLWGMNDLITFFVSFVF
jgi:hypothetical protein